MKKRMIFALALVFALTVGAAFADTLSVEQGDIVILNAKSYKQAGKLRELSDPDEGYILTNLFADVPAAAAISVQKNAGEVSVTMADVNIRAKKGAAVSILEGADVILRLEGLNVLESAEFNAGLSVAEGARLTIESDSDAKGYVGELVAVGGKNGAGIGGGTSKSHGEIIVTGGKLTATGGEFAAGIGGGFQGNGGLLTIEEGAVFAYGGKYGAGIGGGQQGKGGEVRIEYGEVTAHGGSNASGIGGGQSGDGGSLTMLDGIVDAVGGMGGAGIGGGDGAKGGGDGGKVLIEEGDLNAEGGNYGAGIGGGYQGDGGEITVLGGYLTVTGGKTAAGIGGGGATSNVKGGDGGSITVSGGTLTVKGGGDAAGIGGGRRGNGGQIAISGGKINTLGGQKGAGVGGGYYGDGGVILMTDGFVRAEGGLAGAGIGGGEQRPGGEITLSGGRVTAVGGKYSAGIGGGWEGDGGTILLNGAEVTATGGEYASGIGGGGTNRDGTGGAGGTITIDAGTVTASHGTYSAGIGGGMRAAGGVVTINGGAVSANGVCGIGGGQSGEPGVLQINGGMVSADGTADGYACFADLTITGGALTAEGKLYAEPTNNGKTLVPVGVKLPGVTEKTNVTGLLSFSTLTYGDNDLTTDDNGVLNLWLPETAQETIKIAGYLELTTDLPIPAQPETLRGVTSMSLKDGAIIRLSDESSLTMTVNDARISGQVYDPVTLEKMSLRMGLCEMNGGVALIVYIQETDRTACLQISQALLKVCDQYGIETVGFGIGDRLALVKASDLRGEGVAAIAAENNFKESLLSFHIEMTRDGAVKLLVKKGFDAADATSLNLVEVTAYE